MQIDLPDDLARAMAHGLTSAFMEGAEKAYAMGAKTALKVFVDQLTEALPAVMAAVLEEVGEITNDQLAALGGLPESSDTGDGSSSEQPDGPTGAAPLDTPLRDVEMPARVRNMLARHGFATIADVMHDPQGLYGIRDFGLGAMDELTAALAKQGITLPRDPQREAARFRTRR